jgi:TRAP-type mannitol/chloroaromatic compound transport system substrate-binding protein
MKRRHFVAGLGASAAALGLVGCGSETKECTTEESSSNKKVFKWKMVTTWPKGFQILGDSAEMLAQKIESMSGGRIQVKVLGAGELVPALEVFDTVSQGTAQMGHGVSYYWKGKMQASPLFSCIPFGLTAQEMNAWLYYGGGLELWQQLYEPHGVVPFPAGNTGVQMAGWFKKEINSLADIKGLKMRIPGLGGEVLSKAGGEPVLMPGGEVFTSLSQGVIDAAEWIGPANDLAFGFHKIAKNYYYPGWHEPGTNMEAIINKKAFDALPDDLKKIVETACESANLHMASDFMAKNATALNTLTNQYAVQVKRLPDDVLAKFKEISQTIVSDNIKGDSLQQQIFDSLTAFKLTAEPWSELSEKAYLNVR